VYGYLRSGGPGPGVDLFSGGGGGFASGDGLSDLASKCPDWDDIERIPWLDLLGGMVRAADAGAGQVRPYASYLFEGSVVVGQQVGTDA
jgi:hypothetical protein